MQNLDTNSKLIVGRRHKNHVMISYSWANIKEVNLIVKSLTPYIHIWRDKSNLAGAKDLWSAIANAISASEFVISILSPDYEKSESCTDELNYALNNNISVVPVFIDPSFKPSGNVGLRTSKLFFLLYKDVLQSPILFVKHLYAMSAKNHNVDITIEPSYHTSCFKLKFDELIKQLRTQSSDDKQENYEIQDKKVLKSVYESPRSKNKDNEFLNVKNYKKQNPSYYNPPQSYYLGLSSDSENDNNLGNSLIVYGMQTNISGKTINYTELNTPYKLGDCMINGSKNEKSKVLDLNNNDQTRNRIEVEKRLSLATNKNFDNHNSKQSFQIYQSMADSDQYDLYSREKDDLFSFVCQGKHAKVVDSDYQDIDEIKTANKLTDSKLLELMINLNDDFYSCTVHLNNDLILLATQKAEFNLLRPNKHKWEFARCVLNPKFKENDRELYKSGKKFIVDICLDAKNNLYILNRWACTEEDEFQFNYKYTVDLFDFNKKLVDGLSYSKTVCSITDEICAGLHINKIDKERVTRSKGDIAKPAFTRIYNDEKNNCVILVDPANNKINWYKKANGLKKRCIKSVDNSLLEPNSLTFVDNFNGMEIMFICSKSGLIAFNNNFTIKHEALKTLTDIYYDKHEKCLFFLESSNFLGGKIVKNNALVNLNEPNVDKEHTFSLEIERKKLEKEDRIESGESRQENLDIRYKYILSYKTEERKSFKRIISSDNYIFIICENLGDFKSINKQSIFAIDKKEVPI